MLPIDLLELLDCFLGILLDVEQVKTLVIEPIRGFVGRDVVFFEQVEFGAAAETARQQDERKGAGETAPAPVGASHPRPGFKRFHATNDHGSPESETLLSLNRIPLSVWSRFSSRGRRPFRDHAICLAYEPPPRPIGRHRNMLSS